MTDTFTVRTPAPARDSWHAQWLTRLFFHEAEVQVNEAPGRGMLNRTDTPMSWDGEAGRTGFVAHTLAQDPRQRLGAPRRAGPAPGWTESVNLR
jgi:hypothetical protein